MMDGKVDQDVREAAADSSPHNGRWGSLVRHGHMDADPLVQAFARMREAGRQAGLREAAAAMREAIARGYNAPEVKCAHERYGWEDCIACYDDALESAITALIDQQP
ncbi:hypothetical protein YP76_07165 [Sphingobium chungbukense]|uniref:Uncharacterized protein n=1 Tax=Sphingobium chungbukense TaxID=56193 RepID=A0A0M3AS91_9SPHN|nr:hypothetical protein YP76_07165 [Sphingobium chungbukense]